MPSFLLHLIAPASVLLLAAPVHAASALKNLQDVGKGALGEAAISQAKAGPSAIIGAIVNGFLGILGTIFVLLVIYAGFLWMTAQGDEKKVTDAKNILKNATIGLVLIFLAYVISSFVLGAILPSGEPAK